MDCGGRRVRHGTWDSDKLLPPPRLTTKRKGRELQEGEEEREGVNIARPKLPATSKKKRKSENQKLGHNHSIT